jgi:hypothetical protein
VHNVLKAFVADLGGVVTVPPEFFTPWATLEHSYHSYPFTLTITVGGSKIFYNMEGVDGFHWVYPDALGEELMAKLEMSYDYHMKKLNNDNEWQYWQDEYLSDLVYIREKMMA